MNMLLFESFNEIHKKCKNYGIKNYTINSDSTIDVDEDVVLGGLGLSKLPLKFREVSGNFYCYENRLSILEGAPNRVGGGFDCTDNLLITLKDGPEFVSGTYNCSDNRLTTLEGAPHSIGGHFWCSDNRLITLEGAPQAVIGDFDCSFNTLKTLKGAPQSVGSFDCSFNHSLDSIRKLFPDDKTFHKLCMEWEFFAGGNKIWKHKFLEAMLDIGKKRLPKSIPGYEYI